MNTMLILLPIVLFASVALFFVATLYARKTASYVAGTAGETSSEFKALLLFLMIVWGGLFMELGAGVVGVDTGHSWAFILSGSIATFGYALSRGLRKLHQGQRSRSG